MLLLTKYTVLYKENEICCIILLSLPSRERGLKFCKYLLSCKDLMSLPSRERGLKSAYIEDEEIVEESLPSRERGLKFLGSAVDWLADIVAPFAGAWIEIFNIDNVLKWRDVAPFAGAWIEIKKR